ncbi:LuxR C-terminal-related transcriptional regulator [Labedella populi]|nr:LuxR C-terminal-related transcriptional regulator [Labedella populi]
MSGRSPDDDPVQDVRRAEALFRSSEHAAALDILDALDIATLPPSILDRALPLMLMAGEATAGEEFSLRLLGRIERLTAHGDLDASSIVMTYRAEATAEPRRRAELATVALDRLSVSTAPVSRHRAIAVLLAAKVDLGQGFDHELLAQMEELERQIDLVAPVDSALAQRGFLAYQVGLLDESRNALALLRRQARIDGEPFMERIFTIHLATVDVYAGRRTAADDLRGVTEADAVLSPAAARASGLIALRGADEAALQAVLLQPTVQGSEVHGALTRRALIGLAAARREQWREAYQQLSIALAHAESLGSQEPGRRMWIDFDLARAAVGTGRRQDARRMTDRLEILSRGSRPLLDGVVIRIHALLAAEEDPPRSVEMLEDSVAVLSGAGFPDQLVLSLLELGRALASLGRFDDARQVLERAHVLAHQTGDLSLGLLVDRAMALASSDAVLAALTTREREIARAAARGASSRQIAEESFTSVRTVETQLSSVYRKLGITSRAQLMFLLADRVRAERVGSLPRRAERWAAEGGSAPTGLCG